MIIATKKLGKAGHQTIPVSGIDASGAEPRETLRRVKTVRPRTAIVVRPLHAAAVYPAVAWARAARHAELIQVSGPEDAAWESVDAVLGGWGMPVLDEAFLARAPRLKAVFYAAGSVRSFMTEAAWDRGIVLSTAAAANSATTAEFCVGQILFSLKHGWRFIRSPREAWSRAYQYDPLVPGLVGSRVGLVSFGRVAQRIAELLRPYQIEVVAWDPTQPRETFERLGVRPVDLETLISTSDVVSLHLPQLPETHRMIGAPWLARLKPGATLINTSRGDVVDEPALVALMRQRTDLTAVLDVTDPEPPRPDSELFDLPNIVLTPHLAGSYGPECARMGALAVDELERWCRGEPLQHELTREQAVNLA
jgi:phosphoglycerate dehydrogenase-like enzyme